MQFTALRVRKLVSGSNFSNHAVEAEIKAEPWWNEEQVKAELAKLTAWVDAQIAPSPTTTEEYRDPNRTVPPFSVSHNRHHWLVSERTTDPSLAEWLHGQWHCTGEAGGVSPEEMWHRGWRWGATANPPDDLIPF